MAYCFGLVHPFVCFSAFETSHIFGTMYARILKFHICIAYEKLAEPYFFFFSVKFFVVSCASFQTGILANGNLVRKLSKDTT